MTSEGGTPSSTPRPYSTLLRLGLAPLIVHFQYSGYIQSNLLDSYDTKILKKTCSSTAKEADVRYELGTDAEVWKDLTELFYAAARSFADRCYNIPQPGSTEYSGASSLRIVANCHSLLKDIARVKDLVAISRNILCVGEQAQNLAAKTACDHAVFQVITLCVKVTARGFDQNGIPQDEEKWQLVINDFKKLLIRCLEFLNNLTAQNERRKLMLWVELFDSSADPVMTQFADDFAARDLAAQITPNPLEAAAALLQNTSLADLPDDRIPSATDEHPGELPNVHMPALAAQAQGHGISLSPYLVYIGRLGSQIGKDLIEQGKSADPAEIAKECKRRWDALTPEQKQEWDRYTTNWLKSAYNTRAYNPALTKVKEALETMTTPSGVDPRVDQLRAELAGMRHGTSLPKRTDMFTPFSLGSETTQHLRATEASIKHTAGSDAIASFASLPEPTDATDEDYRVEVDANYGYEELDRGKESLLSSLEADSRRSSAMRRRPSHGALSPVLVPTPVQNGSRSPLPPASDPVDPISEEEEDEEENEEESDEDDYPVPGDDGRGLLTDVPLILGPAEIEVLPMIIQSGIVPPVAGTPGYGKSLADSLAIRNMHAVRCHLLLAQNNGQNLLRELLIFVAAWDLREDELYFKILVKIMDSILMNGLMPFSYHAFRESKDIISPAQAVIMKLLTNIFRARQSDKSRHASKAASPSSPTLEKQEGPSQSSYPSSHEARMVQFLFREFREHIIPQTCALIFLQGKIRDGTVSPDDFPFNLWDMERMYEGIYQYLEFFAILTEHEKWKSMMAEWEITAELVTLLEELDVAIPRNTPVRQGDVHRRATTGVDLNSVAAEAVAASVRPQSADHDSVNEEPPYASPPAVAVERPYDIATSPMPPQAPMLPPMLPPAEPVQSASSYLPPAEDEACDFEWRNLKKLAVLVLSSLVWKSPLVQQQLGAPDKFSRPGRGIRALLNCCKVDDYNPYIKEHAIMALRFSLEGSRENMGIVRELQRGERDRERERSKQMGDQGDLDGEAQDWPENTQHLPPEFAGRTGGILHHDGSHSAESGSSIAADLDGRTVRLNGTQYEDQQYGEGLLNPANHGEVDYVPSEVLDLNGYETFVDAKGQVQLKRRGDSQTGVDPSTTQ